MRVPVLVFKSAIGFRFFTTLHHLGEQKGAIRIRSNARLKSFRIQSGLPTFACTYRTVCRHRYAHEPCDGIVHGMTRRPWRRYTRKSSSVVRSRGSPKVSVMRTRQASARLIGMSEYFSRSLRTGSRLSASENPMSKAPRRSRMPKAGAPRGPRRWNASDITASHVDQGGGTRVVWPAAQEW